MNRLKKQLIRVLSPWRMFLGGGWRCLGPVAPDEFVQLFEDERNWAAMGEKVAAMKRGLDRDSLKLFEERILCMRRFPTSDMAKYFLYRPAGFIDPQERKAYREWRKFKRTLKRQYRLKRFLPEVFFYEHGLKLLPSSVTGYIAGKDFIDAGAFIGDSTLVLAKYAPRAIYSCEMSAVNLKQLRKTLEDNPVQVPVNVIQTALGDHCGTVSFRDSGGGGCGRVDGDEQAQLETIDHLAGRYRMKVGLIKADIEGMGLQLVKGMTEVLKRDRPVLSLAVYHNPEEFFEIKPTIEALNLGYRFRLVRLHPTGDLLRHWAEETLLCYPAELDNCSTEA